MVWSEPTGLDILIPGDKDVSNPSDMRDYILMTGDLPDEVSSLYDTAIVWFNGKFSASKPGQQIKYFLIGSKDNVMQHAVGLYNQATGGLTFTALSGEAIDVSTSPPTARSVLGRVNADPVVAALPGVQFANFAQAPLNDWIHKNQVHRPNFNFGVGGNVYKILGALQNGWTADVATFREDVGIYKDVTGRCHLEGSIYRAAGPLEGICLDLPITGPWAPVQYKERVFSLSMQDNNGIRSCAGVIRATENVTADLYLLFPVGSAGPTRVSLAGINWHTSAKHLY